MTEEKHTPGPEGTHWTLEGAEYLASNEGRILGVPIDLYGDEIGYVMAVETMGSDESIVQAARHSYDRSHEEPTDADTRRLLGYFYEHMHTSPLEFGAIRFRIKVPMSIGEQMIRHRTAKVNKLSLRYAESKCEFYTPAPEQMTSQHGSNHQSSGAPLNPDQASNIGLIFEATYRADALSYKAALLGGLAREKARFLLPAGLYTTFEFSLDLHNLGHFLNLRLAPEAQWEVRQVARAMELAVRRYFPVNHEHMVNHLFNAKKLSGSQIDDARDALASLEDLASEATSLQADGYPVVHFEDIYEQIVRLQKLLVSEDEGAE